jgi:hypothetical protein
VAPGAQRSSEAALRANQDVVRHSTITDWLPAVTVGDADPQQALPCSSVAVPQAFGGLGTMSVVGFDAASPDAADVTAVATGSHLADVSTDHHYHAASPDAMPWGCCRELTPQTVDNATDLYAFDLSGTSASYVGAGSVDGRIAGTWSMDEYDGVLRVAIGSAGTNSGAVRSS